MTPANPDARDGEPLRLFNGRQVGFDGIARISADGEKVLEAGMNDHIAKPLNVADMFTTMARWITLSTSRGTLRRLALRLGVLSESLLTRIACGVGPSKGAVPANISQSTQPRA